MIAFLKLTRPTFLIGGALMYGLGLAWARGAAAIDPIAAVVGQLMVTATQLVAQYANEYYDNDADRNNPNRTYFSGGSGILASGQLPRRVPLRAAQVCAGVSLLTILFFALHSPLAAIIGAVSLLGAWFYSAPPRALMGSGWGEVEATVLVAIMTPHAAYAAQTDAVSPWLIRVCLPLFFLHLAMLIGFSLPDRETDAAAGKRTLAVRLGARDALALHRGILLIGILSPAALLVGAADAWWPWLMLGLPLAQLALSFRLLAPRPPWKAFTLVTVASFATAAAMMLAWSLGL